MLIYNLRQLIGKYLTTIIRKRKSRSCPWRIYPDDVYLVSFPRSGNTWVRKMIAKLMNPNLDLTREDFEPYVPDLYRNPEDLKSVPRPRVIKSHESYVPHYPKVVYLYRDGRDCLASWYIYQMCLHDYQGTFEEFVLRSLKGSIGPYGSWHEHVRSWILTPRDTPILEIRYEGLCEDPNKELRRIANFIGLYADDDLIEAAVRAGSREVHKAYLQNVRPDLWKKGYKGGISPGPGKDELFSEELSALFWMHAGDVMQALGYPRRKVTA